MINQDWPFVKILSHPTLFSTSKNQSNRICLPAIFVAAWLRVRSHCGDRIDYCLPHAKTRRREGWPPDRIIHLRVFACDLAAKTGWIIACLTRRREGAKDGLTIESFIFEASRAISQKRPDGLLYASREDAKARRMASR